MITYESSWSDEHPKDKVIREVIYRCVYLSVISKTFLTGCVSR